jgi:ubiquinone biosynthesis monooxygenase Coq7
MDDVTLSDDERKHAAGLMRVNHSGEVCAQALYQGQALTAKLPKVRLEMEQAAAEEVDHLAWCQERLDSLDSQPSLLNPLWYGLSFGVGAVAGLVGDKVSLGFVAATEEQVCKHLESHLQSLPAQDEKSRAVVGKMLEDEAKHAHAALDAGGVNFPAPVKGAMTLMSKLMTEASYKI